LDQDNIADQSRGNGLGMDFGISAIFMDYEDSYRLKIGLAVNDLGKITFDNAVEAHVFQSLNDITFFKNDYLEITDLRDLMQRASNDILGDPTASLDPSITSFEVRLPTSIVASVDYKIIDQVFVSGLYVQRLTLSKPNIERSNLIAITPRYESKWLGAAFPVSNLNFSRTHVGLSLRLAFLTIGTDQLGSLLSKSRLSGGDIYMTLQLFGFGDGGLFNGLFGKKGSEKSGCYIQ
ncbi:MAG: hypothetical protein KJP00_12920, partial [Bacteroidia bacterium]|nr:hypothetical protein [Bacteroidia bacterium]